jgi:hypothetical protein
MPSSTTALLIESACLTILASTGEPLFHAVYQQRAMCVIYNALKIWIGLAWFAAIAYTAYFTWIGDTAIWVVLVVCLGGWVWVLAFHRLGQLFGWGPLPPDDQ